MFSVFFVWLIYQDIANGVNFEVSTLCMLNSDDVSGMYCADVTSTDGCRSV